MQASAMASLQVVHCGQHPIGIRLTRRWHRGVVVQAPVGSCGAAEGLCINSIDLAMQIEQ